MIRTDPTAALTSVVLLNKPGLPHPNQLLTAARRFEAPPLTLVSSATDTQTYALPGAARLILTCVRAPHPCAADKPRIVTAPSIDALEQAKFHMVLTVCGYEMSLRESDELMARLTGAMCEAMPTVGAMLGHGIAFHRSDVFAKMARALKPGELPVWLSIDITLSAQDDGRVCALTHGMPRYGREDFYVLGIPDQAHDAFEVARMLSTWTATTDKQLPTGDTVGRTTRERLEVRRCASPANPEATVVLIELLVP